MDCEKVRFFGMRMGLRSGRSMRSRFGPKVRLFGNVLLLYSYAIRLGPRVVAGSFRVKVRVFGSFGEES